MKTLLYVGAGRDRKARPGWKVLHLDFQEETHPEIVADIRERIPLADGSVDEILCKHVLEHVEIDLVPKALGEFHRVLRKGGTLFVDGPNFEAMARDWLANECDEALHRIFGDQTDRGEYHTSGFSPATLSAHLETAGFRVRNVVDADLNFIIEGEKK